MLRNSFYARIVACVAGVSMIVPAMPVSAAPKVTQESRTGADVVLVNGELNGRLLNSNGKPMNGASVVVSKNGKVVAKTTTQTDGSYNVEGLSSGVHTVSMADGRFPVRLWSKQAAPASARTQFVVAKTAVRGQYVDEYGIYVVGVVAAAALIVGAVALSEAEEAEKPHSP